MTISAIFLVLLTLGFIRNGTLGYDMIAVLLIIVGAITIIALQDNVMIFLAKSLGIVSPPLAFFGLICGLLIVTVFSLAAKITILQMQIEKLLRKMASDELLKSNVTDQD